MKKFLIRLALVIITVFVIAIIFIFSTGNFIFSAKFNEPFTYKGEQAGEKYSVVIKKFTLDKFYYGENGDKIDTSPDYYLNVVVEVTNKGKDIFEPSLIGNGSFEKKSDGKIVQLDSYYPYIELQPNETMTQYYSGQVLKNTDKVSDYKLRFQMDNGIYTKIE